MKYKAAKFFVFWAILCYLGTFFFWPSMFVGFLFTFIAVKIKREDEKKENEKALADATEYFQSREARIRRGLE
jgi:hypothetical protein